MCDEYRNYRSRPSEYSDPTRLVPMPLHGGNRCHLDPRSFKMPWTKVLTMKTLSYSDSHYVWTVSHAPVHGGSRFILHVSTVHGN
jgi:hypothetical protein